MLLSAGLLDDRRLHVQKAAQWGGTEHQLMLAGGGEEPQPGP